MHRRTCYFSGQVQGVGFRYTVQNLAARYNIDGYVRNLSDGRVEVVMEGADADMDQLLDDIKHRMESYIENVDLSTLTATREFAGFNIRH